MAIKQYVLITGASQGIGYAIAQEFAQQGAHIMLCARTEHDLKTLTNLLQKEYPEQWFGYVIADLSIKEQVNNVATRVMEEMPLVNVLVNNAGSFKPGSLATQPDGVMEEMMAINFYSAYHLTRALLPQLTHNAPAHIFNMSSVAGLKAYEGGGAYSISKYALKGFNDNLRDELKTQNIKVTGVYPGATMSRSWSGSGVAADRIMEAKDIAKMIYAATQLSAMAVVEDIVLRPQLGDL